MLRSRLLLGLILMLIILLAMGLYSIDRCSELGQRIQVIRRDNDAAGRNLFQMKNSGAEMTGALLSRLTVDGQRSRDDFSQASEHFANALEEEKSRKSKSSDEKALVSQVDQSFQAYQVKARTFLQAVGLDDATVRSTASQLGIDTAKLMEQVDKLIQAHQQSLTVSGKNTAADVNETVRSLLFLMIAATVTFLFAAVGLSRGLLNPLRRLTASIQQIGEGNLDQVVPVLDRGELGRLATSFNQMAAQLKQYRANTSVELMRLNMTIRATLASFPDPIFVLNSEGAVEFRNPEADQLAVKLLFAGVTRLPEKVDEKVEHVRATGQDFLPTLFKDAIKFHIDGQDRYLLPRIVLLRDDKKETFGVAVILENVTRMLLLDDVKSNLIATVSHELKTPLTSVRMALYLLHEATVGALNDKQADLVSTAREDADRLLRTLNDLLDLAKLEQGPGQLLLTEFSPVELVEAAEHDTHEVAQAAGVTLKTGLSPICRRYGSIASGSPTFLPI